MPHRATYTTSQQLKSRYAEGRTRAARKTFTMAISRSTRDTPIRESPVMPLPANGDGLSAQSHHKLSIYHNDDDGQPLLMHAQFKGSMLSSPGQGRV
jgi:hypothetical protein